MLFCALQLTKAAPKRIHINAFYSQSASTKLTTTHSPVCVCVCELKIKMPSKSSASIFSRFVRTKRISLSDLQIEFQTCLKRVPQSPLCMARPELGKPNKGHKNPLKCGIKKVERGIRARRREGVEQANRALIVDIELRRR